MCNPFRPVAGANLIRTAIGISINALLAVSVVSGAKAAEVAVYTIRSIVVDAPTGSTVVLLDAPEAIERELSANLPHDPARAISLARQRLHEGGAKLQRELADAYEDVAAAWSLGVATLPAVVVDQRYVIYGDADVSRALAKIEAFRSAHP